MRSDDDDPNIGIIMPMTLSNLTNLSIYMNYVTFDKFEMFIKNMHCIFHFQYYECIDYENESSKYLGEPN
jgi:hypothetical protein